jgi:PKD repeat protein
MFGIGIRFYLIVFWTLLSFNLFGQECSLGACPPIPNECGIVNVGFSPSGGVQFCENTPIVFNNTSTTPDFDFFLIDWADGNIDTIYNYNDLTQTYSIPDSALCEYPFGIIPFEVCFQGIKECNEGISCASGGYDFQLLIRPRAIIGGDLSTCENNSATFFNEGCHADDFLWTFSDGTTSTDESPTISFSDPGNYSVTLTVSNNCGSDTDIRNITVLGLPVADASIDPIPLDNKICVGQIQTFSDLSNEWSNTTWQITPSGDQNWCFTDTSMTVNSDEVSIEFKQEQNYTIRLLAQNVCGTDTWEEIIEVLDGPTVNLQPASPICESGLYTPQVTYTGAYDSVFWTFENGTPGTSTDPNPSDIEYIGIGGTVTLVVISACGDFTTTTDVLVNNMVDVQITAPTQFCEGSSPDTLQVNESGGTWSGTGIIDSDLGIFDPSGLDGSYTITYTIPPSDCSSSDMVNILVNPSASVSAPNVTVCEDDSTIQLTADPAGGEWSGPFVSIDGVFDINASGVGIFPNTYSLIDGNGCNVEATPMVTVNALPQISMLDTTILCSSGGTVDLIDLGQFVSDIPGGSVVFTIDGSLVANPYDISLSVASYPITATYTIGPCTNSTSGILSIIPPPSLSVSNDTSLCINLGTYQLTSNIPNGKWDGPGATMDGEIDLSIAGGGTHTYTYTILPNTTCETIETAMITITDPSDNLNAGIDTFICENDFSSYTFSGFSPNNGTWSGAGITDSSSGTINIDFLEIDSLYTYQYCVENDQFQDCEACDSRTFIIRPLPEPAFEFTGGVCIGESFTIINNTTNGETYMWDFGDGTTSNLQEPTHSYSISGSYTITLTANSEFGCTKSTSLGIYVSRPPTVDFTINTNEGCAPLPVFLVNNSSGDDINYEWIINGDTSTIETPTGFILDQVTTDTIIEVRLNVINSCGTVTQVENVLVHPYPIVKIDSDEDEGCSPLLIDFVNKTTGNPETYLWDLGNGNISTDSIPPDQIYTTTDSTVTVYTVSLTSTNECGTGYGEFEITVFPPDVKAFIAMDTTSVCQNDTFQVFSLSTAGSDITWSVFDKDGVFVDGYNVENPEIVISEAGEFMIVLYASKCGTDTDTSYINVLPAPEVEFDIPDYTCLGDSLFLSTISPNLSETIWDFGDGNTSNESSTYHTYDTAGIYIISLTAYSSVNNCPFTITKSIEVLGLPTASFVPDQLSGCRPLTINFDNNSQQGDAYFWNWNDGTSGSTEENPSHTFNEAGTFEVSLRTFDEYGCFADTTVVNIIVHDLPISDFITDSDTYCQYYDSIHLTNNSIDAAGSIWLIENDSIDLESPVISPEVAGMISIELIVINQFGCEDKSSKIVNILPSPTSIFSLSDTIGCQPLNVSFDNISTSATDYMWSIGNEDVSSDINTDYTFGQNGSQTIQLVAVNNNGCPNDTSSIEIEVLEKPEADFGFVKDQECGVPNTVVFNNLSTSDIVNNTWTFGAGGPNSSLTNPIYEYTYDDDFEIQLHVENAVGCLDTALKTVPIWLAPEAIFYVPKTEYCEGEPIEIINESINTVFYSWEIEGQDDIADYDPQIVFDASGEYNIKLIVEYNEFCKDTLSLDQYFQIYEQPIADFIFDANQDINILGDVDFTNQSLDYSSIIWDLGDGNTSEEEEFSHEYDINRDVFVTLTATNDNGGQYICTDSITKPVAPEWLTKFFAPNAMSPNYGEEGVKYFTPKGVGIAEYEIKIYSPWGETVWTNNSLDEGRPIGSWKGEINNSGNQVPMGAYTWFANVIFVNGVNKTFQGTVTVLR